MRLTVRDKSAMIGRILNDLPKSDAREKTSKMLLDAAHAKMPKNLYQQQEWLNHGYFYRWGASYNLPAPKGTNCISYFGEEIIEKCDALYDEWLTYKNSTQEMKCKLEANFSSVTTVKKFIERFPDLVKYLPKETEVVQNLPATTNLTDELKKMGLVL